jgi:hypothetical protein
MRDKFIFLKASVTSEAHKQRQYDIIQVLAANKASRKTLESVAYAQLGKDLADVNAKPFRGTPLEIEASKATEIHSALNKYERPI